MRVFLTLCSLVAVGLAKPQYNYGSGVSGTFGGSSGGFGGSSSGLIGGGGIKFGGGNTGFSSGSSFGSGSSLGGGSFGGGSLGGGSLGGGSLGGGSLSGGSLGGGSFGSGSLGGGSLGSGSSFGSGSIGGGSFGSGSGAGFHGAAGSQGFEPTLVHKQFITVAAPEDNENLEKTKHLVIGRPQKNYRVVFIKAPSSSNANVKLSAEYAPKEEKTVIYVLSKKDNTLEVGDIATPAPTVPSKPEVFFIKYKTEEEAQHAQRQIQAEYDQIEGSSEHTDAGVAPQQSVIGILGNGGDAGGIGGSAGSFGSGSGSGSGSSGSFSSGGSSTGSIGFGTSGSVGSGNKASAYLPPAGQ